MLGVNLDKVGDETVRDALAGIDREITALQSGPFAQLAGSIKAFLDKLETGAIVVTIQLKPKG